MKKLLVCVALMGLVASTAMAEPFDQPVDRSQWEVITTVTAERIDAGSPRAYVPTYIYDHRPFVGPYFEAASAASGGNVSAEDYNTVGATTGASLLMREFWFVGGVAQQSGVAFFTFYDVASAAIGGFGIRLPYAGAYHWQITMSSPRDIPDGGYVNMWADTGNYNTWPTTGLWWMEPDGPPSVGTTGPYLPGASTTGGAILQHHMGIVIPEPASLALFGMGLLTLVVRRR